MNFIYIHLSPSDFGFVDKQEWSFDDIPSYTIKSMFQTRMTNPDSRIFLLCNTKRVKNIDRRIKCELLDIKDYIPRLFQEYVNTYNKFKHRNDAFWLITLLRYIYCEEIMSKLNLDKFLFVEGDNLIYVDIEKLSQMIIKPGMFTCCETAPGNCSSGIFYCNDRETICRFNDLVLDILKTGVFVTDMSCIKSVLDMKVINLFTFPGLPNSNGMIFDPSGWGFYLGGDNHKHEDSFIDPTHLIGKFILKNKDRINIYRENQKYFLEYNGQKNVIINLHIANKLNIDKFITYKIYD